MSPLLEVSHLTTRFHTRHGIVHAVEDVSFHLNEGESLGIVGESGSGKSVCCYSLMGLIPQPPGKIHAGKAMFAGQDLLQMQESQLRQVRGKRISMIFQDPMNSLNPYIKIVDQVMEPLLIHQKMERKKARHQALLALEEVGIDQPERCLHAYPHEFSGGMRQRVMIAMALITKPELLICDEPTTALDVTTQAQVLDLIKNLRRDRGTSVIFITHDLAVVSQVCDRIQVMYAGQVIESAEKTTFFNNPRHAYTRSLLQAIPATQAKGKDLYTIVGLPPRLFEPPHACAFSPRNTMGDARLCLQDRVPELIEIEKKHYVQNCPGCLAFHPSISQHASSLL